ncbi:hypothetical protein [Pedobacter caeni]|uniref:Tellurite resistance protein TerB n=1 Tax=Pedobacter caeni TaxID=288992 RepID=A0A1M5BBE3_9SPHI|nr:hypothetical protein [Pedobacter caeni]SHF39834.1 hypothetical protein SAMN04488522_1021119 [Pedobacter caeni]
METSNRTSRAFYQQLAKLFYAVAATDGKVRPEEIDELRKIVKNEWLSIDTSFDEYGTDFVYYILITFDWLYENDWDIKKAIPEFKIYKKNNEYLFRDPVNQLIFRTSAAIASAFAQRNKSELVFLSQLDIVLKNKEPLH